MQGNGNSNLGPLLSMAQTPQAAAVMQSLGIDPQQATALLNSLKLSAKSPESESSVKCVECNELNTTVQWQCTECDYGPLHDVCRSSHSHDEWRTNFASDESVNRLLELSQGRVDRMAAIELLNASLGSLENALNLLWDQ